MTTLVEPVGAGTLSYTTSPVVNQELDGVYTSSIANGTNYTFSAKDGRGYKFAYFRISVNLKITDQESQSSTESILSTESRDNPVSVPVDANFYLSKLFTFEGTVNEHWLSGTLPDNLYTYSDLTVTAVFVPRTGRPIRNAAGTNLVRAASGLILVDA